MEEQKSYALENENWIIPHEKYISRKRYFCLCTGYASGQLKLEEFGPELDLEDLKQYLFMTDITDNEIKGEVLYIDEFGNCQTNISPQELTDKDYKIGDVIPIKIDNQELSVKWCETYKNETIGGVGVVVDSWGMVSLFLSNGNAQKMLNCKDNSKVVIKVSN